MGVLTDLVSNTTATNDPANSLDISLMGTGDVANMHMNDNGLYDYETGATNNYAVSNDATIQANINAQNKAASAMPLLPNSSYFPSADNNIQKGSYQGSIVGNVPIYAPSHLVPFGAFDARQQALNKAAAEKAKANADFMSSIKAPETTLFSVQGELDDAFTKGVDAYVQNAKKVYGDNWSSALKQDQGFNNYLQSMNTAAKYSTGIATTIGDMKAQIASGKMVLTPDVQKLMTDLDAGVDGLQHPFSKAGQMFGQNLLKARAVVDLNDAVNETAKEMKDRIKQQNPGISDQGMYDMLVSQITTGVTADRVSDAAQGIYDSKYSDGSGFTKQQVQKQLQAVVGGMSKTLDIKTVDTKGANANEQKYDDSVIDPENVSVTFAKGSVVTSDGQTFEKPINLNAPNDLNAIDPSTGERINIPANSRIQVGKTFNVAVDSNGRILQNEAQMRDARDWHYETYASGTVVNGTEGTTTSAPAVYTNTITYPDGTTKTVETNGTAMKMADAPAGENGKNNATGVTAVLKTPAVSSTDHSKDIQTIWTPVESIKSGLATTDANGNVVRGARIDIQSKNAKAKTEALHKGAASSTQGQTQTMTGTSKSGKAIYSTDGGKTWLYK